MKKLNKEKKKIEWDWYKYDKRSAWNKHWEGKHTKKCIKNSLIYFGQICSETGEYLGTGTDLERYNKILRV